MAETLIITIWNTTKALLFIFAFVVLFFLIRLGGIYAKYWLSKQRNYTGSIVQQKIEEGKLKQLEDGTVVRVKDGKVVHKFKW